MSQTVETVDMRERPLPEGLEHLEDRGIKAIKYGHTLYLEGLGLTTRIINEIREKIDKNESVVICITGPPGKGKTYFGIRFAQKLDTKFHIIDIPPPIPYLDTSQVTFSREQIAYLTGENTPLERGQVILTDESHWGIGARSWQNRDQQEVVNYLAAIRSKGFVLIIIVLHTRMIDALLRDFVLNYEFQIKARGVGTIYRRYFPPFGTEPYKNRLGRMKLRLPDYFLCSYLDCLRGKNGCKYLHAPEGKRCETIRAIYERRKNWFLNEKGRKEEKEQLTSNLTTRIELMRTHFNRLRKNSRDNLELSIIQEILEENNEPSGENTARSVQGGFKRKYPELMEKIPILS